MLTLFQPSENPTETLMDCIVFGNFILTIKSFFCCCRIFVLKLFRDKKKKEDHCHVLEWNELYRDLFQKLSDGKLSCYIEMTVCYSGQCDA